MLKAVFILFISLITLRYGFAQVVTGSVIESLNGDPVNQALITYAGTKKFTTDSTGQFKIDLASIRTVTVSAHEHITKTFTLPEGFNGFWILPLDVEPGAMDVVNITHSRQKEKLRESPVTVESQSAQSIKETPAVDFYEGLGHLRGVDVTAASMGFRIVNTRGFNSTSPVRSLQLIDGVDNQAPGLNFSLGNFLGASELDVALTEIIVGASSAYYGPNAFNGVIKMTTKSPWTDTGLSAQLKLGERQMAQLMLRYAYKYRNIKGRDVFAWKFSMNYLRAYDWIADNMDPTLDSKAGIKNPGGYDAVNRYGDEIFGTGNSDQVSRSQKVNQPGLERYYRDGYLEKDLVNYNTRNFKTNLLFGWKINPRNELQYSFNFGTGTTVYQGDNRYSLNGILFFQNRLEWIGKNGHLRFYATNENAGNTYDAVLTAFLMQSAAKPSEFWYSDYLNYWNGKVKNRVKALPGYAALGSPIPGFPNYNPNFYSDQEVLLEKYNDSLVKWHAETRAQANTSKDWQGNPRVDSTTNRLIPGTPEFNALKDQITGNYSYSKDGGPSGSRFYDKSAMYHLTGEKRFSIKKFNFTVGFSARMYRPNSNGTIFLDTGKNRITNKEGGIYAGFDKRFYKNRYKISITTRVDKNQNFNYLFSPAASLIYSKFKRNTFRISFSSAIRNPTLQDQYLHYNVGRAILLGNLNGFNNVYSIDDVINYINTRNRDTLKAFNVAKIKPEAVKTVELGYKGFLLKNHLLVDAGYYYSIYKNFIGYRVLMDIDVDTINNYLTRATAYRVASNSNDLVSTQGLSAALSYFFAKVFMVSGNWSLNLIDRRGSKDPLIPAFNTPKNKFNIMFGCPDFSEPINIFGRKLKLTNYGFNINYKWVQGFRFEGSPQFTGNVPTYWSIDVQANRKIPTWNSTLKIGASNITNNQVFQVYGGPRIGRMAYISFTYQPQ